jgi:hypothetical protein
MFLLGGALACGRSDINLLEQRDRGDDGPRCARDGEPCGQGEPCCSASCARGSCGACREGAPPVALVSGDDALTSTDALAIDDTSVYWGSSNEGGRIRKVDKLGGEPITLASGLTFPSRLLLDAERRTLYFGSAAGVQELGADGGEPTLIEAAPPDSESSFLNWRLAQDRDALYWTISEYNNNIFNLSRMLKDGGTPELLLTSVYRLGAGLAVDDERVYWGWISGTSELLAMGKTGGPPVDIVQEIAAGIVFNDGYLYYTSGCDDCGQVRRVATSGGQPEAVVPGASGREVAVDDAFVYWVSDALTIVKALKSGGGDVVTLAADLDETADASVLAIDETCLYWLNNEGDVWKVHK